jgi:hypothetical protein
MQKPEELSIWKTMATVGGLNNSLPLFPNGRVLDKSLPQKSWRYWSGPFPKLGEPNST